MPLKTEHKIQLVLMQILPIRLVPVCQCSSGQVLAGNLPVRGTGPRGKVLQRRDALFIALR